MDLADGEKLLSRIMLSRKVCDLLSLKAICIGSMHLKLGGQFVHS